ncbi:lytic transglycosylase domain-containing protein [Candidatus Xenohaliotis californiensis]
MQKIFYLFFLISLLPFYTIAENYNKWSFSKRELFMFKKSIFLIEDGKKDLAIRYTKKIKDKDMVSLIETAYYAYNHNNYDLSKISFFNKKKISSKVNFIENTKIDKVDDVDRLIKEISDGRDKLGYQKKLIVKTWVKTKFSKTQEDRFLSKYATLLSKDDHINRADHMLQSGAYNAALRLVKHVPIYYRQVIESRIALKLGKKSAVSSVKKIPKGLINEPGLVYDLIVYQRGRAQHKGNVDMLLSIKPSTAYAEKFWHLKRYYARDFIYLNAGKSKIADKSVYDKAYKLAANHNLSSGVDFFDAEWLAGWIALRFLNNSNLAIKHFTTLHKYVRKPISVARANYWLGRSYDAIGQRSKANLYYSNAGKYFHTFYGQLSILKLKNKVVLSMPKYSIDEADYQKYYENIFNKYTYIALNAGQFKLATSLASVSMDMARSKGEIILAIRQIMNFNSPDVVLAAARKADGRGVFLPHAMYPTMGEREKMQSCNDIIKMAIIRQESGFDKMALSRVGALGLMQIMPKTAEELAVKAGVAYNKKMLFDPEYNMNLGSFYIIDLLKKNKNSLVLALSSYNAGPFQANRWVSNMGGLSNLSIDERVDWIESIPFNETRNYVQRILESVQMYKYLANNNKKISLLTMHLLNDLK